MSPLKMTTAGAVHVPLIKVMSTIVTDPDNSGVGLGREEEVEDDVEEGETGKLPLVTPTEVEKETVTEAIAADSAEATCVAKRDVLAASIVI